MNETNKDKMIENLKKIGAAYEVDACGYIHVVLRSDTTIEREIREENGREIAGLVLKKGEIIISPEKNGYEVFLFPGNGEFTLMPKST